MPPKGFNHDEVPINIPVAVPSLPPPSLPSPAKAPLNPRYIPEPKRIATINLPNNPSSQSDSSSDSKNSHDELFKPSHNSTNSSSIDATVKPDDSSPIAPLEPLEMIMAGSLHNILRKAKKTPAERKLLAEIVSSFNEIGDSITAIAESDEEGEEDPQTRSVQSLVGLVVKTVEKVIPLPSLQLRSLVWAPEEDTDSQGSLAKQLLKQKEMREPFDEVVKRCISAEKCTASDELNVTLTEGLTIAQAEFKKKADILAEVESVRDSNSASIAKLSAQLAGIYAAQEELRAANIVLSENYQAIYTTQEELRAANVVLTENYQADKIALREELQADRVLLRKELQMDLAAMKEGLEDIAYEKETVVQEFLGDIRFLNDAIENLMRMGSNA